MLEPRERPITSGRYRDRFERVDGTWRFADRLAVPDLLGDLSGHLMLAPIPDGRHGHK